MSDFTDNFWSWYVAALTLIGILGALVLLWATARQKIVPSNDNTTGHVWDGDLRESNNPMPRWWMWLFVISVVYSLLYLVAYPGLGAYQGEMGWSTRGEYDAAMVKADKELAPLYTQFTAQGAEDADQGQRGHIPGPEVVCEIAHGSHPMCCAVKKKTVKRVLKRVCMAPSP